MHLSMRTLLSPREVIQMERIKITNNSSTRSFSVERDNFGEWVNFSPDSGIESHYTDANLTDHLDELLSQIEKTYQGIESIIFYGEEIDYEACRETVKRLLNNSCRVERGNVQEGEKTDTTPEEYLIADSAITKFVSSENNDETLKADNENEEISDETISSIVQIYEGETKIFKHKNIHLMAYINCAGNLIFDHCIINYNETNIGDEITLQENASLTIKNSEVICKGVDTTYFISSEGLSRITIESSSFEDCSFFIKAGSECIFSMTDCKIHNCFRDFLELFDSNCVIGGNIIIQDGLNSFYTKAPYRSQNRLIEAWGENSEIEFYNNTIIEEDGFKEGLKFGCTDEVKNKLEMLLYDWSYFDCAEGEVRNCTFKGIGRPIIACSFVECRFEKCTAGVKLRKYASSEKRPYVDDCLFIECTNVITVIENTRIVNCQFLSCYDKIIEPARDFSFKGGVSVELCQFINTENKKEMSKFEKMASETGLLVGGVNIFCVAFSKSSGSNANTNHLKKCIFDGVVLGDNYLIGAVGNTKPSGLVAEIENCDFRNCVKKDNSKEIINKRMKYRTLLKVKDFYAIYTSDCKGLDKINHEATEPETIIRNISTRGNTIGSTLFV